MWLSPQGEKELSQMILFSLSRNISGHPRDLNNLSQESRKLGALKKGPKHNIRG